MELTQHKRGETLEFSVDGETGRDAPEWSVTYRLAGMGSSRAVEATQEGRVWKATVPSSVTRDLPSGLYEYEAELTDGETVRFVDEGRFEILPSLAYDDVREVELSFARQALAKVEEVLLDASESADVTFSIAGQSHTFESRQELMAFRETLRNQVRREDFAERHGTDPDDNEMRFRLLPSPTRYPYVTRYPTWLPPRRR